MVFNGTLALRSMFTVVAIVLMGSAIGFVSPCSAQAQLIDRPQTRTVRVGFYENEPKVFTNDSGQPSGIFVGILEAIARRKQWSLVYVPCEWPGCMDALEEGRIDLMPDVAFSTERSKRFDFNEEAVVDGWSQVYAVSKKPMNKLSDLNGLRLGLLKGSIQQAVLKQTIRGFGCEVSIVEADSYEEAFTLATKGKVDAVVTNQLFGDYHYEAYGLVRTGIAFNSVSLHFATARGTNHDLLEAIDHELRVMKSEPGSVFYTELALWMERPQKVALPRYLIWIMGGIVGFLVFASGAIVVLRRQVGLKTRHLVQANETLRESEEKFRSLFQNHMAVKLIIDPETGEVVEANEAAARFYGWSVEELRGRRIQDIDVTPLEGVEVASNTVRSKERSLLELRHRLADGSVRDVEVWNSKLEIGGRAFLHSIVHDITEGKRTEEALRESRELLHGIFDSIPVRVFWKDRDLLYRGCNAAFARDAGFERPEDVIGKDDHAMCWREQADLYQADDRAVIESGEAKLLFEETQTTPSGESIHLLTSKVPLRAAGGAIVGLLGTYYDVTDRVQLEDRLRQAEKMETVGRLAGGIAHDFNNLLTVINGTAELAAQGLREDSRLREQLDNIRSAGKRAADLTRQLLAFSRRQILQPVVVNLNSAVMGVEPVLRRLIGEDVHVNVQLATELGNVRIDPTQVEQILLNLASNSRDAMPDGGTLTIRTENVMVDEMYARSHLGARPGPHVMLAVSDTGHGMDEATQRRVFEPFFTTKVSGKGTGLGLATVYGIVKQCDGSIWVYSEVGKGTTIKIYFPRTVEAVRESEPAPVVASEIGTETILVVEDEDAIRSLVRDVLEEHGYTVLDAANGNGALKLLESHEGSVQLLLTDVVMPDMGGRELAERLHDSHPGMKVLFTSGYTDDAIVHYGVLDEGVNFIGKPYSVADLTHKVREVLDS
jgi:PAS domain S-box-containing protein